MKLAALLALGACAVPPVVEGGTTVAVTPTAVVRHEWTRMELCVGRVAPMEDWRWFVVEAPHFREPGKPVPLAGLTVRDRREIYLAMPYIGDTLVVRHEILHALGIEHAPVFAFCGAGLTHRAWWYR